MKNDENIDFWFLLSVIANICQVESYFMNIKQTSNDEIMKGLEIQNEDFLKILVTQNKTIIKLLEEKNGL